jgi:hypothetical protein
MACPRTYLELSHHSMAANSFHWFVCVYDVCVCVSVARLMNHHWAGRSMYTPKFLVEFTKQINLKYIRDSTSIGAQLAALNTHPQPNTNCFEFEATPERSGIIPNMYFNNLPPVATMCNSNNLSGTGQAHHRAS